jgi:hypothetical protein
VTQADHGDHDDREATRQTADVEPEEQPDPGDADELEPGQEVDDADD